MSDPVGRLSAALAGRYIIERELGVGGMATVYLARDLKHERLVALKVLRPELGAVVGVERFLAEIRVTAALQHPNILPLFDSGEADGLVYYAMPHVKGETLRSRLDREQQLPIEEAVAVARAVASALDYAHRHGVIHRDVKPENILFQDGQAVVTDFGVALALTNVVGDRLTEAGLSLGTPFYMSPEQATGDRPLDARSDVYSLGCVLYETLTGEPPHTGRSTAAVIARILTERPRDVRELRESVPPALDRVVARALARLPADRYMTAAKLGEALALVEVESRGGLTAEAEVHSGTGDSRLRPPQWRMGVSAPAPWAVALLAVGVAAAGWLRPRVGAPTPEPGEVSTEELAQILENASAIVLDTRPHLEYAISHIPGAFNVAARPGVPMSMYVSDVAEVSRLVGGDLSRPIVLYCNGPWCPKSRRLADELEAAGHTDVRRYQLGMPVWRAYGGVTVIEADGLRHVLARDRTAVVIDAREPDAFRGRTLPSARNIPRSGVLDGTDIGEIRLAKDDGRLPMEDHNARIIVVGRTADDARLVAQAIAHEAFHNVAFFPGTFEEAEAALAQ
ncbi:MAG TPA: protein kinase [Longimicrobiales bacterium]|nr:protein kinase [Longimicrobiales bacterium]